MKSNLLTFVNNTTSAGYYWLFKKNDTVFASAHKGMKGDIAPGQTIRVELDKPEIKIGLRKDDGWSKWIVEPALIETNRDVEFSKSGKVSYTSIAWTTARNAEVVTLMTDPKINNAARSAVIAALGKIPTIGGALGGLTGMIWKEVKPDVAKMIEDAASRMRDWVRGELAEFDKEKLNEKLSGFEEALVTYNAMQDPGSRQRYFENCITLMDDRRGTLLASTYRVGSLALITDFALLDILLTREAVAFSADLNIAEADRPAYAMKLSRTIGEYQTYIMKTALPAERTARDAAIEVVEGPPGIGSGRSNFVRDMANRQVLHFSDFYTGRSSSNSIYNAQLYRKQALNRFDTSSRIGVEHPTKMWSTLDPNSGVTRPIEMTEVTWVGPSTGLIFQNGNEHGAMDHRMFQGVNAGSPIRQVVVRHGTDLDYFGFIHADGKRLAFGDPKGGHETVVEVPEGVWVTRIETYWDWELMAIKIDLSNGQSSGKLGDSNKKARWKQTAVLPGHQVCGLSVEGKPAPYKSRGHAISFAFCPAPDFYEPAKLEV